MATAFASIVFPVPGGPYIKTPYQGLLIPVKNYGASKGNSTASFKSFLHSLRPAISSKETCGFRSIQSRSNISTKSTSGPTPSG